MEPRPRGRPADTPTWTPALDEEIALPAASIVSDEPFLSVLDERRSTRKLKPTTMARIGTLLWHAARTRGAGGALLGEHRAAPSAGGIHPIELLIVPPPKDAIYRYDPVRHVLGRLGLPSDGLLAAASEELQVILPDAKGSIVLLAADVGRTDAAYEHATSLIWRDAGCLLMVLQLVATWLHLGSCPLGVLAGRVTRLAAPKGELLPAGGLVVGEPEE